MRVILQEKIVNLGNVGDQVTVKPGFARNFLLPQGKALRATADNIADFEARREELDRLAASRLAEAKARAEKMQNLEVTVESQASDEGKLYGSIGPREVADAVVAAGYELEKREVTLPEGPIRMVGEYDVSLSLHGDVHTEIKLIVKASV